MPEGDPTHALRFAIQLAEAEGYAECAAGLRTALAHLERTQWRPIDSYDSYSVVIFSDGEHVWPGHRHTTNAEGPEFVWFNGAKCEPTHWMPLPPSPETPR